MARNENGLTNSTTGAGSRSGASAVTLSAAIDRVLLPLAALNYACATSRTYFEQRFAADLSAIAGTIPSAQLLWPKPSLAGPVLHGLAFSHEELPLRDLYLGLLATSLDRRTAHFAHPAFAQIIQQLTAEEAQLLRAVLTVHGFYGIAEIRLRHSAVWNPVVRASVIVRHVVPVDVLQAPMGHPEAITIAIDNWVRLGLVGVEYGISVADKNAYAWVEDHPMFHELKKTHANERRKISIKRGAIHATTLGHTFARGVGLLGRAAPDAV